MSASATVTVRIRGYSFSIRAPYAEGQRMGEAEVQQLNDLRADNIRNNMTKPVLDAIGQLIPGEMLSPAKLAELQATISNYDEKYHLQLKHMARPRVGAIEAEARLIAEERLEADVRKNGLEPSEAELAKWLAEYISLPEVQELARARVMAKQQVLKRDLGDLL